MSKKRNPVSVLPSWKRIVIRATAGACLLGAIPSFPGGAVDLPKYPHTPEGPVKGTPEEDAWVAKQASHIFISRISPGNEFAEGSDAKGAVLLGIPEGNSMSRCPSKGILCLHTHPLEDVGNSVRLVVKMDQPWRLGFGVLDYQAVVKGMPNYMLNYQRQLQVLEYIPFKGYYVRSLGVIEYTGEN
jgi:hypothetical protein